MRANARKTTSVSVSQARINVLKYNYLIYLCTNDTRGTTRAAFRAYARVRAHT